MMMPAPTVSGAVGPAALARRSTNTSPGARSAIAGCWDGVRPIATTLGSAWAMMSTSVFSSCETAAEPSGDEARGCCAKPASGRREVSAIVVKTRITGIDRKGGRGGTFALPLQDDRLFFSYFGRVSIAAGGFDQAGVATGRH